MRLTSHFMKKSFIFSLLFGSLSLGVLGGVGSSYLVVNQIGSSDNVGSFTYYVEESELIEAQQTVAPAVVSVVQYVNLENVREQIYYGTDLLELSGGTAFIVDPSGIAFTNKHVVSDQKGQYMAIMNDGTELEVVVEALDEGNDFAIIRLMGFEGDLPYVELGDSSSLQVGQQVLAIGNALAEYENTTTAGIISATGRKIIASDGAGQLETLFGLIQTDAAINPGNSGGPLVNLAGQVIGINTAVDAEAEGIGFAIPIDDVKSALESWEAYGEIVRPFLGVRYIILTRAKAKEIGFQDVDHGALVVGDPKTRLGAVVEGSPADKAGIEERDIILEVEGEEISFEYTLQDAIMRHQVGDTVTMQVLRDGETFEINVELTNQE